MFDINKYIDEKPDDDIIRRAIKKIPLRNEKDISEYFESLNLLCTAVEKNADFMIVVDSRKVLYKVSSENGNFGIVEISAGDEVVLEAARVEQAVIENGIKTINVSWIHKVVKSKSS